MNKTSSTEQQKTLLNEQQRKAVELTTGPLVVIAGAGSGKTRVITSRIVHLLQKELVHPAQIVALTFTNKAAKEMKERVESFLPHATALPFIGTFHSYCLYLLRTNKHLLPYDTFSILDEDDKRSLITKLLKISPLYKKQTAQQISYTISLLKNKTTISEDYENNPALLELIQAYETEKKKSKCFDFDDLLIETVKLFDSSAFQEQHHFKVKHILIDEYQDTNHVQHDLLKKMALLNKELAVESVCVVGDEDQSIYSWRGATVDNIVGFKKDFKDTVHIKIEQNYRSKQPILHVANQVIKNNKKRNEKTLWSEKKGTDCVRLLQCFSGYQEADIIAQFCKILAKKNKLTSTAILYRTHFQSRLLEEALIKQGVAYQLIGGIRFYERKEIKDILAYLRLIVNPFDRVAFTRVINTPLRGLGDKFVELFHTTWDDQPLYDFKQVATYLCEQKVLPPSKEEMLKRFLALFSGLHGQSEAVSTTAHILTHTGYLAHIQKSYEKNEAQERQANIKEFLNAAHYFAKQGKTTLEHLLNEVSLLQEKEHENDDQEKSNKVVMMTLHATKGLEFDNVIITGLEEGLFPSPRSINETAKLEEERRLFYVGITRARNKLLCTQAKLRHFYGQTEHVSASRFLDEVPEHLCKADEAQHWQRYEITRYFSQWLGLSIDNPDVMTFRSFIPSHVVKQKKTTPKDPHAPFRKHQTVKHKSFGLGVVKMVEKRQAKTFVVAQFKSGLKKVDASFLQSV